MNMRVCNKCKKDLEGEYSLTGAIHITGRREERLAVMANLDFCSVDCMSEYVQEKMGSCTADAEAKIEAEKSEGGEG